MYCPWLGLELDGGDKGGGLPDVERSVSSSATGLVFVLGGGVAATADGC